MKKFYIAAFVLEAEQGYSVYFPDLPQCVTSGLSPEECILMAEEALQLTLESLVEQRAPVPEPSPLEHVKKMLAQIRQEDELPMPEEVLYQYIPAPVLDTVPVRISVSLPKSVLTMVDDKARQYGFTRSGFLARAAQAYAP